MTRHGQGRVRMRQQKKAHATIRIGELDYLRLTHARDKVTAALVEGQAAVQAAAKAAEQQVEAARAGFVKQLAATAQKYRFDPNVSHRFDDKKRTLTPE